MTNPFWHCAIQARMSSVLDSLENIRYPKSVNVSTLKHISSFRGISQSKLAKAAGISRQAVSLWFKNEGFVPVASNHLLNLSRELGTSSDILLNELADTVWWKSENTNLLWDRLYNDLGEFLAAANKGEHPALARLVEVYGLFASAKILDRRVWDDFPKYKSYLPPVRRKELESLWETQKRLRLI